MREARDIVKALGGRWFGSYGLCHCPAHMNTRTPALSVATGDDGRLLLCCHAGCSFAEVIAAMAARRISIAGGHESSPPDPGALPSPVVIDQQKDAHARAARRLWSSTSEIHGTAAETYLKSRGISCALPGSLRFHKACRHTSGALLPALVGHVEGSEGFGVHRTFIRDDGAGKASVLPAKAMLGACKGGAVRVWCAPGPLVVAEGIETALSIASGLLPTHGAIWATLSTSGMKGLRLPVVPGELIIASDGDAPGRDAAFALATRAQTAGWTVSLLPAPDGRDWNDELQERTQ